MSVVTTCPQRFGARALPDGSVEFRLWAPSAEPGLRLEIEGRPPMVLTPGEDGFAAVTVPGVAPGARYRYRLADGQGFPDPASRQQDGDIDDRSIVTGPDHHVWRHEAWMGAPWESSVIYETHAGLAGGFDGLRARLPMLAALGVTLLELMPIGDFPGPRNWGYDGVLPFAPDTAYGSPEALKSLVDAAHGLGMGVIVDVVYNHFGPGGNYLPRYAAPFFRRDIATPWGAAIDFRQPEVRSFFEESALHWLTEYRCDGLRLDAVHAIAAPRWLAELPARLRARLPDGRKAHLIIEDDLNRAALLTQGYDAQWNDDLHHVLHHLLTGERQGYYEDYGDAPAAMLARCLAQGWAYQGEPSPHRGGAARGEPSAHLPPTAFVSFLQNHDQIGNRAQGDRLSVLAPDEALRKAAIALQLLAPQIPLIFMGEEIGSRRPFRYFTSFTDPDLIRAVREGRRREHAEGQDESPAPDPNSQESYEQSRPWNDAQDAQRWYLYYQRLLRLRHARLAPRLIGARAAGAMPLGAAAVRAEWRLGDGAGLCVHVNLAREVIELPPSGRLDGTWKALHETRRGAFRIVRAGRLPGRCAVWSMRED